MTFANLSLRFGERMLKDMGVPFDQVLQVDFNVTGDRGYSELTPGFSEYPVHVNYTRDGKHHLAKNTYEGLWEIVEILEDIDGDIQASW